MSIQGGDVGAQAAAEDIIAFIQKRLDALDLNAPVLKGLAQAELRLVLKHAESIRDSAKSGYY